MAAQSSRSLLQAIIWLMFSILVFQGMIGSFKYLSPELSPFETGFWRNFLAIPIILPFVLYHHGFKLLAIKSPKLLVARAGGETGLSVFNFVAITVLPLAQTTALVLTYPIWTLIGAWLFLKEHVGPARWVSAAAGFIGMVIIVGPALNVASGLVFLPIIAAMFWASSNLILRHISQHEFVGLIMFWMVVIQAPIFLVLAFSGWTWPSGEQWLVLWFCAICGTLGQYGLTLAHRHAEASQLAPFGYAELVFASIFGAVIFTELPPISTFVGGAIIAAAGIYMARQEHERAEADST